MYNKMDGKKFKHRRMITITSKGKVGELSNKFLAQKTLSFNKKDCAHRTLCSTFFQV